MPKSRASLLFIGLVAVLTAVSTMQARSQGTKVGLLTCRTSARLGLVFTSHQRMNCRFDPDNGGPPELYTGEILRLGVDLGFTAGGVMVWGVFAPTSGLPHGALAGNYGGAHGSASFGVGLGAKVLVGGSHRSIALQPVAVEANTGVNLAAGIASLRLRAVH